MTTETLKLKKPVNISVRESNDIDRLDEQIAELGQKKLDIIEACEDRAASASPSEAYENAERVIRDAGFVPWKASARQPDPSPDADSTRDAQVAVLPALARQPPWLSRSPRAGISPPLWPASVIGQSPIIITPAELAAA